MQVGDTVQVDILRQGAKGEMSRRSVPVTLAERAPEITE